MIACRLRLEADDEVSRSIADFVETLSRQAELTPRQAYRLRLAVDEIATNVALHGYRNARGGVVDLEGGIDDERVWVRIEDDAPAFDPTSHDPGPLLAVPPARREAGGLGLYLALRNVDDFTYDRVGGRNRNTLFIVRTPARVIAGGLYGGRHGMPGTLALVVAEPSDTVQDLDRALRADGFEVMHATPADLAGRPEMDLHPDLLLVSASLGLQRLALLSQRFESQAGRSPTTVVFPDGDLAELEACVRGGFEYVTPPFLPSLLRTRVSSCWERWQLTMTVEEMAAAASLREYERELSIAHEIQSGFLPDELPIPEGWELATRFEPAKQVGGDFYDVFELIKGQRIGFVVADVCDKGVGAALFMALIRTLIRHTAEHTGSWNLSSGDMTSVAVLDEDTDERDAAESDDLSIAPLLSVAAGPLVQAVVGTNRYLARNHLRQGYFATMFFGVLDPTSGALLYINGGHNPPVLVRANGDHTMLGPTGPAVGMLSDSTYRLSHTTLGPGDALFVYTDGVVEARDAAGELFGTDRTIEVIAKPGDTAEGMLGRVDEAIRHYVGSAQQTDDITMLAIHRKELSRTSKVRPDVSFVHLADNHS